MQESEFLARVDPELADAVVQAPVSDLSGDIPAVRVRREAENQALLAAAPDVPEVASEDHLVPGWDDDPDVRVRVYRRRDAEGPVAGLLWIHGGAMCFGSIEQDDFLCRTYARQIGCAIASVDYRLAPEHPYPAPVDDCSAALRWFAGAAERLGLDRDRIAIGGASAGGGLAAATALRAHDRGDVAVRHQFLFYPMLDDRHATPSCNEVDYPRVWNGVSNRHAWAAYLGDLAGTDDVPVDAAPARAGVDQLRGLPAAYIDVGELDPFRDEDIAYAAKLLQAGVPCELHVTPGAYHASEAQVLGAASSRRIRAYRREALQRALGRPA